MSCMYTRTSFISNYDKDGPSLPLSGLSGLELGSKLLNWPQGRRSELLSDLNETSIQSVLVERADQDEEDHGFVSY